MKLSLSKLSIKALQAFRQESDSFLVTLAPALKIKGMRHHNEAMGVSGRQRTQRIKVLIYLSS